VAQSSRFGCDSDDSTSGAVLVRAFSLFEAFYYTYTQKDDSKHFWTYYIMSRLIGYLAVLYPRKMKITALYYENTNPINAAGRTIRRWFKPIRFYLLSPRRVGMILIKQYNHLFN